MSNYLETNFDLSNSELVSVIDELPLWSAPFGLELLNKIDYKKNITALDIGFGLGFPLLEVAMRLGGSSKVYGIDPWKAAIERTKIKALNYGIRNIELIEGVAEQIPLQDNSVDLIFSNNGINNVKDIQQTIRECSRIIKPGGQFVFTFNTNGTMKEFYTEFEAVLRDNKMLVEVESVKDHIRKKRPDVQEVVEILFENRFVVNETRHNEFYYRFSDASSMFNHFLIRLAFIESWKNLIPEKARIKIFKETEARLNNKAPRESGVKLSIPFVLIECNKE